jgi:membrane fusion protein (multidrug efflux system)
MNMQQAAGNGGKASNGNTQRKRALLAVFLVFALAGVAYGAWWTFFGRWLEDTDDAYVGGNVVQITPQVPGTVIAIRADDTDYVKAGDELVRLDQADASIAVDQAEAQLARTVREVRGLYATDSQLTATIAQREADLARAKQDLARREPALASGAVSGEEIQHSRDAVAAARAALDAAREQYRASRALTERTALAAHPDVKAAAAKLREAYVAYTRTVIPAPVSGFVAKRSVQVGQRVAPGTPLMAVVPLDQVWVDANFKESQLADVRIGQPALVRADLYGGGVEYHGKIVGFGAGTGAAFSLLPAQNATGNWIKVVQRLPVRIALDAAELAAHPLQIGLSLRVEIDTHQRGGARLAAARRPAAGQATDVFATNERLADERVAKIIAENSGRASAERAALAERKPELSP